MLLLTASTFTGATIFEKNKKRQMPIPLYIYYRHEKFQSLKIH